MALAGIWCQIIDCISLSIECIFTEKKKKKTNNRGRNRWISSRDIISN